MVSQQGAGLNAQAAAPDGAMESSSLAESKGEGTDDKAGMTLGGVKDSFMAPQRPMVQPAPPMPMMAMQAQSL